MFIHLFINPFIFLYVNLFSHLSIYKLPIYFLYELFQLPREQVFLITIQNLVNEHVAKKKGADGKPVVVQDKSQCNWNVDGTVNLELFATIHDLLTKVGNMEAAMACARWTMTQLPMGRYLRKRKIAVEK